MLRYLRRLADRDLALDRTMIPLGSCTMKLNATTEMIPITWPEFVPLHSVRRFTGAGGRVPGDHQRARAHAHRDHSATTRCSLQPNAGLQGSFAACWRSGKYHAADGANRTATCASFRRRRTAPTRRARRWPACGWWSWRATQNGNVDIDDLKTKVGATRIDLWVLMVTYPSTHGVFETHITDICALIHEYGGQVYMDGANMNVWSGLLSRADSAPTSHTLNLHKTFCIPHGGGGPGVGPVAVRTHLAPFLPNYPVCRKAGPGDRCRVRSRRELQGVPRASCRSRGCTSR